MSAASIHEVDEVDVVIVGAGPVGGTLACRLAHAGLRVALIDRAPLPPMEHPDFDGRAYAIAHGARPLLEGAGVWERLGGAYGPIREIHVSDGKPGRRPSPLFLHFDVRELGEIPAPEGEEPAFGWMIEARELRRALNLAITEAPGLALFAPMTAEVKRAAEGVEVRLADGRTLRAALVIAAEGRESPLRRAAGIPVTRFAYRQSALVTTIAHERPHQGLALEHFLPAGPIAQLPLPPLASAEHASAIVWTERPEVARALLALDDRSFIDELARRLGSYLGALRPLGRRWVYPLSALIAHRYYDQRLVLAGDAAHGIHPIAGQGLNLGFQDAIALAELLIEAHAAGRDIGAPEVLAAYQQRRRPANLLMLAATDALDRLFSNDLPPLRLARDLGIAAVHRFPFLKRAFMRQAMGLPLFTGLRPALPLPFFRDRGFDRDGDFR
jgi:2-octaprenyl-6-methoxyphenol hydroxylase